MKNADCTAIICEFVRLTVEAGKRRGAVVVSDGTQVPFGSLKHVKDLERRIQDLTAWRDRMARGSEARANYARLVSRLKAELNSARRISLALTA